MVWIVEINRFHMLKSNFHQGTKNGADHDGTWSGALGLGINLIPEASRRHTAKVGIPFSPPKNGTLYTPFFRSFFRFVFLENPR